MKVNFKKERVESALYQALAMGLYDMNDPLLKSCVLHLDEVLLKNNSRTAICYISVHKFNINISEQVVQHQICTVLKKASGFLKQTIHHHTIIRVVPNLLFKVKCIPQAAPI